MLQVVIIEEKSGSETRISRQYNKGKDNMNKKIGTANFIAASYFGLNEGKVYIGYKRFRCVGL